MVAAAITVGVRLVGSQGARLASVAREAAVRASSFLASHTPAGVKATITSGMTAGGNVLRRASERMAPIAAKVAPHVKGRIIAVGAAGGAAADAALTLAMGDKLTLGGTLKAAALSGFLAPLGAAFAAALGAKRAVLPTNAPSFSLKVD